MKGVLYSLHFPDRARSKSSSDKRQRHNGSCGMIALGPVLSTYSLYPCMTQPTLSLAPYAPGPCSLVGLWNEMVRD